MKKRNYYRFFLGYLLILTTFILSVCAVSVSWVLRDGLGPDAIASKGLVAFERFFKGLVPTLLIIIPIGLTGLLLASPILRRNGGSRRP